MASASCDCEIFVKQGTNYLMGVRFKGLNLDDVSSIDFILTQNDVVWEFAYPSNTASRRDGSEDIVDIVWTEADTWKFKRSCDIAMDTRIYLANSWQNPQTPIKTFRIGRTLFPKDGDAHG